MTADHQTLAAERAQDRDDALAALTRRLDLPARILMAAIFLISGYGKLAHVGPTQAYMEAYHVPGILVWPAAAWELAAGVLLVLGLKMRPLCLLLAGWCLLTAAIFHTVFADPIQEINFLKNLTMAGGFLLTAKLRATTFSLDARMEAQSWP